MKKQLFIVLFHVAAVVSICFYIFLVSAVVYRLRVIWFSTCMANNVFYTTLIIIRIFTNILTLINELLIGMFSN